MQEDEKPRFCSDCGMSLVNPGVACKSRMCEECGREIFYIRQSEDGGIRVEKGEKFHLPEITISLDPVIPPIITALFSRGLSGV